MESKEIQRASATFDLDRLKTGDNDEWTIFVGYYMHRLTWYAKRMTRKERFAEDAACNAIASVYVARMTFSSAQHLIAHMYSLVKYECLSILKGHGDFIMSDDVLMKMDHYASIEHGDMDFEERLQYERWKDRMIQILEDQAVRLPRRWRTLISLYLKYGREDVKKYETKKAKTNGAPEREYVFDRLREMILYNQHIESGMDKQLSDIRDAVSSFSKGEREIFSRSFRGATPAQVMVELGVTRLAVRKALQRCRNKLGKVWQDPMMGPHRKTHLFINSIQDPRIRAAIEEGLQRESPLRPVVAQKTKPANETKLTLQQVVEIRRLARAGSHTETNLAAMFKVTAAYIASIIDNKTWKNMVYVGTT